MKEMDEEQVLCFESKLLSGYSSQKVFYIQFLWDQIRRNLIALPRSEAEQNFQYKQLIAYGIIKSNECYLTYKRTPKGGESRLWKRYSIGIGGHINSGDQSQKEMAEFGSKKTRNLSFFYTAVQREIDEEIMVEPPYLLSKPELKFFINDDSDEVGKVHFGLVWLYEIKYPKDIHTQSKVTEKKIVRGTKGLAELDFLDIETLKANKPHFESWSQLIIDAISGGQFI